MKDYYDARAPEYDDWWLGRGLFADRDRPGWEAELAELFDVIEALPPTRTLDVACGTGFLTQHLRGDVIGLDQSARMLDEARQQAPQANYVQGDALELPFPNDNFGRLFTSHFYGHLEDDDRRHFLGEARRVARELVIVDASRAHVEVDEEMSQRILNDGTRWQVYKRYFVGAALAEELGGGEVLHEGLWFVVVRVQA